MALELILNVRTRRRAAGLSQAQLAERVGVSQTWISRLERGQENPTLDTLVRLAKAFGIRLIDLLDEQAA